MERIMQPPPAPGEQYQQKVEYGSIVTIEYEGYPPEVIRILHPYSEKTEAGDVSPGTALAQAIIGKVPGNEVSFPSPKDDKIMITVKIIAVE